MKSTAVSEMCASLVGSEVLKIAGEIQELKNQGREIINFTVGDFDSKFFPIPTPLQEGIQKALREHQTNYPPSSGIPALRSAVANFYRRELKLDVAPEEILIAGGARPLIYTIFTTLLNPGDTVLYPVPSWNNNHYVHLARARGIALTCKVENGFQPTAAEIRPYVRDISLLCLNSPLNPTGTVFSEKNLREISELVLEENKRRATAGQRPLYVMYDQIYFKITHGSARHIHPLELCPELKPWVCFVDGLSKYFCGTGLRVGWSLLPKEFIGTCSNVLGHVGAWAPKPEQIAAAAFLNDAHAVDSFTNELLASLGRRLTPLYEGIERLRQKDIPLRAVEPQGGIYLSLFLRPRKGGTDEEIRKRLLNEAGIAVVPFQAFGLAQDTGWFRLSVGAVSESDISRFLEKVENFLKI